MKKLFTKIGLQSLMSLYDLIIGLKKTFRSWIFLLWFALTSLCLIPGTAPAQFTTLTNEQLVNTTTAGEQWVYFWSIRSVAMKPDGGYVVAWIDNGGLDGQAQGIFGQMFDATGTKVGTEFQVNTTTSGSQTDVTVAVAPDGSFLIGWDGPGISQDVFAQLFTKDGVKKGTEFLLSTTVNGNQKYPEVQFYPDGTFLAAFADGSNSSKLQKFDADGRTIGLETTIISGVIDGISINQDKTVLITFDDANDVWAQLFDINLQPLAAATRINTTTAGIQRYLIGRVDAEGNMVFVWESDGQDGSGIGIYYKMYWANFTLRKDETAVTSNVTNNQTEPKVAVEYGGRFVIAWTDDNNLDGGGTAGGITGNSVRMREFDTNGNPVGSEYQVNQSITGNQSFPVIDVNAAGKFVVDWEGNGTQSGQIDAYGVYTRLFQLSQTGTTSLSVAPTATVQGDEVTITMTITNGSNPLTNVDANPLSVSGTNGVFATLVSGPTPPSVGTLGAGGTQVFTWIYRVTTMEKDGVLLFGGNAHSDGGAIFPFAVSNIISVKTALFINDLTSPNLIVDSNVPSQPDQGPRVFTIGAKITNSGLNDLTDVIIRIGDGTTAGTFPVTTMTLAQTNNTYQGSFSLLPLAGTSTCTRPIGTMGGAKPVIAGGIDFNGDNVVNTSDDGTLNNGRKVIDGRVDVNGDLAVNNLDDLPRPPGLFYGYREPAIIDGYVDTNGDGIISALDNDNYGGETLNVYWQVVYQVLDASGQPTYGNCNDFTDDLRYNWTVWIEGKDGAVTRTDEYTEFAKCRCEISANANKLVPNPGGFISSGPPLIIAGKVDVNSDGTITTADDGPYYGKTVIDGLIDYDGSGTVTTADDGLLGNGFNVIDGYLDVNKDGVISATDNGVPAQVGQTITFTIHNATFGSVGAGFDENRDNLWDQDFWYQPVGETTWPATSFRLVDIQSDVTGSGGGNPLNGITTHYDNEPYLSRLIGDLSGTFDATYTYTFLVIAEAASGGVLVPYQEAASGTNNEKYNGDYGISESVYTNPPNLDFSKQGSPKPTLANGITTWTMTYTNLSTEASVGYPLTGNGVVVEDAIPANTTYVAGSATCGSPNYPCTRYYSTDFGVNYSTVEPLLASSVTNLRWHIEVPVPPLGVGTVSFQTRIIDCNAISLTNTANLRLGNGPIIKTASDQVNVVHNKWIGLSTDWTSAANWDSGLVPSCDPPVDAYIPVLPGATPNYPVIPYTVTQNFAENIFIENGAQLTLEPGANLTVCECVDIEGPCGLYLKSDAVHGNASFVTSQDGPPITYGTNGYARVEVWLTACDYDPLTEAGCWHYVTPSVTNEVARVFQLDYLKTWIEPTGQWSDYITSIQVPLVPFEGYAVSNRESGVRTFYGHLNDGTVQKSLTRTTEDPVVSPPNVGWGWNLVGNPYPSEIDLNSPLGWTNVDPAVYYFDQSAGNYVLYAIPSYTSPYAIPSTGCRYIPSMQGFFVHVFDGGPPDYNNLSGTITFNDDNRTTTDCADLFYKDEPADQLLLKAEGSTGLNDQAIVYFRPEVTTGFDYGFDFLKLYGFQGAPQLCAVTSDDVRLSVEGIPFAGKNTVVPLEFSVETNGTGDYSIKASKLETFPTGTTITLEDKKTQATQELTANPVYNFSYVNGDDPARFLLHFYNPLFGIEDHGKNMDMQIYSYSHDIYLQDFTGNPEKGEMFLYNMMGQEVAHKHVSAISLNKYTLNLPNGYYIVRVITKDKTYNSKVYLD
jgi:uncharacterized repeat protein (TIGR01451 family)